MVTVSNRTVVDYAERGLNAEGYGAMSTVSTHGEFFPAGYLPHKLADITRARRQHITQVIYSYGTPIAWLDSGEWIVPIVSYSVTTGKHQGYLPYRVSYVPADVSETGYLRVLHGLDVFERWTGKISSPHAADEKWRTRH